jgi:hypothetical protein
VDVIRDVDLGGFKHVHRRHDSLDLSRVENSSVS